MDRPKWTTLTDQVSVQMLQYKEQLNVFNAEPSSTDAEVGPHPRYSGKRVLPQRQHCVQLRENLY